MIIYFIFQFNYKFLQLFGLQNAKIHYVTDNDCSMKAAFDKEVWISCASHNLNLVQKHTFDDIQNKTEFQTVIQILNNSKELVTYAKQSEYLLLELCDFILLIHYLILEFKMNLCQHLSNQLTFDGIANTKCCDQ